MVQSARLWTVFNNIRIALVVGSCEFVNEMSRSMPWLDDDYDAEFCCMELNIKMMGEGVRQKHNYVVF